MRPKRWLAPVLAATFPLTACGDDTSGPTPGDAPSVVVTTSILGDVVAELLGDAAEVTTIMPIGVDPHEFQASARQAAAMRDADLLVVNGAGFEHGLEDLIAGAEEDGVPVFEAISAVDTIELGGQHGTDPHFFTDPARMAAAARGLLAELAERVPELDTDAVRARAEAYVAELVDVDGEVEEVLSTVPDDARVLVTNHEVFGYFADRYGFAVVGTVIPSGSTSEGASAGDLAELVGVIEAEGVRAIFADTSAPDRLARTLSEEVGDVEVVELFSESLSGPGSGAATYLEMVRTNAERVAAALT